MPNLSQRELLSENIFTNVLKSVGKGIKGGAKALSTTANLARSTVKALDPEFYSTVAKPLDVGIQKLATPSLGSAWNNWWRAVWPNAEEKHFLEFLEQLGYLPDPIKKKVNGSWNNGSIYVVEVDYDKDNNPIPLTDDNGKIVSFRYPLHFKLRDDGNYQMTKSPSATGRRTYVPSANTRTQNTTQSTATQSIPPTSQQTSTTPANILRQYYRFLRKKGLGIYDPIESNVFGSFLVKKIGVSPNATRSLIAKVTRKPFDRTRKLTPQQIVKIAQILSQRGII
jgi:hypothetical protein